jgi:hypothetical protein
MVNPSKFDNTSTPLQSSPQLLAQFSGHVVSRCPAIEEGESLAQLAAYGALLAGCPPKRNDGVFFSGPATDKINVTRTRVSRYKVTLPSFRFLPSLPLSTPKHSIDLSSSFYNCCYLRSFDHTLLRGVIAQHRQDFLHTS